VAQDSGEEGWCGAGDGAPAGPRRMGKSWWMGRLWGCACSHAARRRLQKISRRTSDVNPGLV